MSNHFTCRSILEEKDNYLPEEDERSIARNEQNIESLKEALPELIQLDDILVRVRETGKKIEIQKFPVLEVAVNRNAFSHPSLAFHSAVKKGGYISALREGFQLHGKTFLHFTTKRKQISQKVLELFGMKKVKYANQRVKDNLCNIEVTHFTLQEQFDYACEYFSVFGNFPDNIASDVKQILSTMPKVDNTHALEFILSGNFTFNTCLDIYEKQVMPLRKQLVNEQKEREKTQSDSYEAGMQGEDREIVDESEILDRVRPFYGGYYRQGVFTSFNTTTNEFEQKPVPMSTFVLSEPIENLESYEHYSYEARYVKDKKIALPNKGQIRCLPLPDTLTPKNMFDVKRDENGCFYIMKKEGVNVAHKTPYSLQFILKNTQDNKYAEPRDDAYKKVEKNSISNETKKFLEQVKDEPLSNLNKARKISKFVRTSFKYSNNEDLSNYYKTHVKGMFAGIEEGLEVNCNVAQAYYIFGLLRELGIPSRAPYGYYVNKDPRFDFAALAGTGHMWSEVWCDIQKDWVLTDATPPGENQNEDEENDEDSGEENDKNESYDGDYNNEAENEILSEKEIEDLIKDLDNSEGESSEEIGKRLYREANKVSQEEWKKVEKDILEINNTVIPAENSIRKRPSTFKEEWESLFEELQEIRKIPTRAFRGPVAESRGDFLIHPVDVTIQLLSNIQDPIGYLMEAKKEKKIYMYRAMEDDVICDLTASMENKDIYGNSLLEYQRKMILASTYNMMLLNEKLNNSHIKDKLLKPLQLRTEIASIHGIDNTIDEEYSLLKDRNETITEAGLVHLDNALRQVRAGIGDMTSALRVYREGISEDLKKRIQNRDTLKVLTIFTDGNFQCSACGREFCNNLDHKGSFASIRKEVRTLRQMGVIVQGIGFTDFATNIHLVCENPEQPESKSAVVVNDVSEALMVRHQMLMKNIAKLHFT